jgi:uracil-DNA glycosylase
VTPAEAAVASLLADLVAVPSTPTLCNFYRDDVEGAERRRQALSTYLLEHWDANVLMLGEAPGYRGARLSGVPFSAPRHIWGVGTSEASATIVRRELEAHGLMDDVLLWNIVPFHPHKLGEPASNDTPQPEDAVAHVGLARRLAAGRLVVTVGDVARSHFPEAFYHVRHPSFDKARVFPEQMAGLAAALAAQKMSDVPGTLRAGGDQR